MQKPTICSCPSLLRIILLVPLLLQLVYLLLTLQNLLHELQLVARGLPIAEGILNGLGTLRLGFELRLRLELLATVLIVRSRLWVGG